MDPFHLFVGQLEIEDIEVIGQMLTARRLRDGDDVRLLDHPPERDLGGRLVVSGSDLFEDRITENTAVG